MNRAIAISITRYDPFYQAMLSAKNFGFWLFDAMYGTQKRANRTYAFAIGLLLIASFLTSPGNGIIQACPV